MLLLLLLLLSTPSPGPSVPVLAEAEEGDGEETRGGEGQGEAEFKEETGSLAPLPLQFMQALLLCRKWKEKWEREGGEIGCLSACIVLVPRDASS